MPKLNRTISVEDRLIDEIKQTGDADKCNRSCAHHVYNDRSLVCVRRKGHELSPTAESVMAESHIDYVMQPDYTTALISFDESCCKDGTDGG